MKNLFIEFLVFMNCFLLFAQDGTLDTTFGTDGIVLTEFGNYSGARDGIILPDGKIIVAGVYETVIFTNRLFCLVKYNEDGSVDQTFGNNGIVTTDIAGDSRPESILLQNDGKIIVGGVYYTQTNGGDLVVVRYNSDGSLDNNFGTNGLVTKNFQAIPSINWYSQETFGEMCLQNDGKIIVTGSTVIRYNDSTHIANVAIFRLNNDGTFDQTFGLNGVVQELIDSKDTYINGADIQSDGKIVVAGYQWYIPTATLYITLRYNQDGSRDNTFGNNGIVMPGVGSRAEVVKIQPDGKILVAGTDNLVTIHRYNIDGILDTTFNGWGVQSLPYAGVPGNLSSISLQRDGKIIVAGYSVFSSPPSPWTDNVVARINPNGSIDYDFGPNGSGMVHTIYNSVTYSFNYFTLIQPDDKIIVGGQGGGNLYGGGGWFAMARYNISQIQIPFSTSFTVQNSWNIVSFPGVHPNSMLADTLFRFRDQTADVFSFNSTGYHPEDTLKNGVGYWLKHNGQYTYNWDGTVQGGLLYPQLNYAEIDSLDGNAGWNIIGCYDYEFPVSDITTIPPGIISGVLYSYNPGLGYQPAVTLQPGKGYFTKMSSDGKIIYPPRSNISAKINREEMIKAEWAKITITDADGKEYILYSTEEEGQLDNYLLPPKPPAGLFDVRYTTDRFVEDLTTEKTIDITGATYPIKIKVVGMDVIIRDAINGEMLNINLSDGEDIVVENKAFNKLVLSSNGIAPTTYELSQNYPNPFNPSTTIEFSLPEDVINVKLSIYSILGEKVAELVNTSLVAGKYLYQWNAQNVATGIYIYELRANDFVSVKKMILIK